MSLPASVYYYFHKLQLDVVAGALFTSLWISHISHATIPPWALLALCLSVWIIYTMDHLGDALKYPNVVRYDFYRRHWRLLLILLSLAAIALLLTIYFLPFALLCKGLLLLLPIMSYQLLLRYRPYTGALLKEAAVALVYASGTGIFMWSQSIQPINLLALVWLFFLTWTSILTYSMLEAPEDGKQGMFTIAHILGNKSTRRLISLVMLVAFILMIPLSAELGLTFALPALGMMLITFFLPLTFPHHRYWGELAFLIPAIWFLIYVL
jgi:hypothetical protein